jgi:hypothetical protein
MRRQFRANNLPIRRAVETEQDKLLLRCRYPTYRQHDNHCGVEGKSNSRRGKSNWCKRFEFSIGKINAGDAPPCLTERGGMARQVPTCGSAVARLHISRTKSASGSMRDVVSAQQHRWSPQLRHSVPEEA